MARNWKILDLMTDGGKAVDGIGPIKSVKRLSDDKIFSIGDRTFHGPISSFFILAGDVFAQCGYIRMYGYDGAGMSVNVPLDRLE